MKKVAGLKQLLLAFGDNFAVYVTDSEFQKPQVRRRFRFAVSYSSPILVANDYWAATKHKGLYCYALKQVLKISIFDDSLNNFTHMIKTRKSYIFC